MLKDRGSPELKATDGIMQMDFAELFPLYIQCRTDAGLPDQDGKYFKEFILVVTEILTEMVANP